MSEVKKLIKGVQACEKFAKQLELHGVKIEEVEALGDISPSISENIQFLRDWVAGRITTTPATVTNTTVEKALPTTTSSEPWLDIDPDAEWRRLFGTDLVVSNKGKFYNYKKDSYVKPAFIDGELRVAVDNTPTGIKRASVLVARAFGYHSFDRDNSIMDFKDGDRRNLALGNLQWVGKESARNETLCLIEDICRRIVEFNGDVDKILAEYEDSKPRVTTAFVKAIINKEVHANVSNGFFIVMDNKIYPRKEESSGESGMDTAGFLIMSGDKKMSKKLIKDKIARRHDLSITEKTMLVFMAMDSIGGKKVPDVTTIARAISNEFKIDIAFDFIEQIRNDYSSEIAKIFGR